MGSSNLQRKPSSVDTRVLRDPKELKEASENLKTQIQHRKNLSTAASTKIANQNSVYPRHLEMINISCANCNLELPELVRPYPLECEIVNRYPRLVILRVPPMMLENENPKV